MKRKEGKREKWSLDHLLGLHESPGLFLRVFLVDSKRKKPPSCAPWERARFRTKGRRRGADGFFLPKGKGNEPDLDRLLLGIAGGRGKERRGGVAKRILFTVYGPSKRGEGEGGGRGQGQKPSWPWLFARSLAISLSRGKREKTVRAGRSERTGRRGAFGPFSCPDGKEEGKKKSWPLWGPASPSPSFTN